MPNFTTYTMKVLMIRGPGSAWIVLGLSWAALAFVAPAAALATPAWLSPSKIAEFSEDQKATVAVAMDARGDTAIAWVQPNGARSVIEAAWRPVGGAFGTPVVLSSPNMTSFNPLIAMDPQGDTTVAWLSYNNEQAIYTTSEGNVSAAWRPAGGTFSEPVMLTGREEEKEPVLAMDPQGEAILAWVSFDGSLTHIEETSRPAGGSFSVPKMISNEAVHNTSSTEYFTSYTPAIAVDPNGDVAVVWQVFPAEIKGQDGSPPYIQIATRSAEGAFSSPVNLSASEAAYPAIAMNAHGETTVVWEKQKAIEVSTRKGIAESFETPLALPSEVRGVQPKVAMDAAGDITVACSESGLTVVTRSAHGSFGSPVEFNLSDGSNPTPAELAMDDQGNGAVVWADSGINGSFAEGSTKPAGGTFGAPVYLSSGFLYVATELTQPISVAMDSRGNVASAWIGTEAAKQIVEVAGYQSSGPSLEALQTPTEGEAGTALAFSVTPQSVWSTVASTTWSWGDGSPDASGTSVTHAFKAPGAYQVSVSATDALGNLTNATRTITIQASPANHTNPNPNPTPAPPQPKPKAAEAAVSAFTPLFATRASTGGSSLGLLVGIPAVKGARAGDTIVVRCTAGCQRPLHEIVHVRKHHDAGDTIAISPPLPVYRTTRIEIELLAPGHVARFVQYHFIRTTRGLIAYKTHKGCLSPAGRPRSCP
jgi:PKD repeat protein